MSISLWQKCVDKLESELSAQQFNTWIRPLHAIEKDGDIVLLAPNKFVQDWINDRLITRINEIALNLSNGKKTNVIVQIGSKNLATNNSSVATRANKNSLFYRKNEPPGIRHVSNINLDFTFDTFVEGKSNQLAKAASLQVAENSGGAYNPLFLYGGVGLGKTHLMHAIGNLILEKNPDATVVYLHSERFVQDMVKALQHNAINDFKRYYRSVNALTDR